MALGELPTGSPGGLVRGGGLWLERGVRASLETHPAVSSQEDGVLHGSCRNYAGPYYDCTMIE